MSQLDKNLTWGEFKKMVESQGVNDDMEMSWIDWSGGYTPKAKLYFNPPRCVEIANGRFIHDQDDDEEENHDSH